MGRKKWRKEKEEGGRKGGSKERRKEGRTEGLKPVKEYVSSCVTRDCCLVVLETMCEIVKNLLRRIYTAFRSDCREKKIYYS